MVTPQQVISRRLSDATLKYLSGFASACAIGGRSQVRDDADRQATLQDDQLIGIIGHYVGSHWLRGDATVFQTARWYANIYPLAGDGGSDVPGANIDFKASRMRASPDPLRYRLAVRPKERHPGMVYVLVLVSDDADGVPRHAHLVGWASESELPSAPESSGALAGAFCLPAHQLHPLPPFQWWGA